VSAGTWPELPLAAWQDTYATLHLWTQVIGKLRLVQTPWINHAWHVTLYVNASGLTTSPVPYGMRTFEIQFDFLRHRLVITTSEGRHQQLPLEPQSVAAFYRRVQDALASLDIVVHIYATPSEIADAIPFAGDEVHRAYDPEYANRYWRILLHANRVFTRFRARFGGKVSPVHYFWGAPDLAVTRFSGRPAPLHPGGVPGLPDRIVREAYSHEVSSCGFWAGGGPVAYPVFYSYAYPEPPGFRDAHVAPDTAVYNTDLGEFLLPYDSVRLAPSPDETLLTFLQSTYEAAADLARWDRAALERSGDAP
jgi:hypothetical protein